MLGAHAIYQVLMALMVFGCPRAFAYTSLGELFQEQLANLSLTPSSRSPYLGGGNLYHCCLLAVNDSLSVANGDIIFKPGQTILHGTIDSFLDHQFPCDTVYNGSSSSLDQPQVTVTYDWCHMNCPGWQVASNSDLGEWVRPLISYIAPSAVFVLSIPRRRRIKIPAKLGPEKLASLPGMLALFYKMPAASLLVTIDTIIWMVAIFAISGPLLLSGIYEALLDNRILSFLEFRVSINNLSVRERAHLLLIVLLGNLDYHPAWKDSQALAKVLPNDNMRYRLSTTSPTLFNITRKAPAGFSDPNNSNQASSSDEASSQNERPPLQLNTSVRRECYSLTAQSHIDSTKLKLKSILASQTSFGTAVGAALVFYMGSFIYTLVESEDKIGDSWTAHNIGFGMFWMIVPHISIVSSLLLAGNNPNIWQGISAMPTSEPMRVTSPTTPSTAPRSIADASHENPQNSAKSWQEDKQEPLRPRISFQIFDSMYDCKYKPAWLWDRGPCKAMWVAKYISEYRRLVKIEDEVQYWSDPHGAQTTTSLDNVNQYNFHMARRFWLQCGVSVTVFLVAVTYIGWWYQERLRAQFVRLVDKIDDINEEQILETEDTIDLEDYVA
ncbi:MAG: hypothetical protein Q9160_003654 [Pyrenula sp. 1 TL-2023]